jgi:hypothetical protein
MVGQKSLHGPDKRWAAGRIGAARRRFVRVEKYAVRNAFQRWIAFGQHRPTRFERNL